MMLNKATLNGKRILKPETVAEMTRKQTGEHRELGRSGEEPDLDSHVSARREREPG